MQFLVETTNASYLACYFTYLCITLKKVINDVHLVEKINLHGKK